MANDTRDEGRQLQTATLGGGCFWCLEAVYELVSGVESVVSGYAGGHVANPSYEHVCAGSTGHAEVAQITFDADVVSYSHILDIFFTIHDPTTLNRQGYDIGPQYRSIILYHDDAQKTEAEAAIGRVMQQGLYGEPVVTQVEQLQGFYPAEDYHQKYYRNNPGSSYCQVIIAPKVAKFREKYLADLRV